MNWSTSGKALGVWVSLLASAFPGAADVVRTPKRAYGLGELRTAAISPDQSRVASAGQTGAFIWDAAAGRVLHRLEAHGVEVTAVAFSPEGTVLLTGARDGSIREWDAGTGAPRRTYAAHAGDVLSVAFAPDGRSFVSASTDNYARVWSLESGAQVRGFHLPGRFVHAAIFSPDGSHVVTADGFFTNNVGLWNLATGARIRTFGEHAGMVRALAFLADGRLATGGEDQVVHLWNWNTGERTRTLTGADSPFIRLVPQAGGPALVAGCFNGLVISWDVGTGQVLHQLRRETTAAFDATADAATVLLSTPDSNLELLDHPAGTVRATLAGHTTSTMSGVAFSPDGRFVLSGGVERNTRLWNRTNSAPVRSFVGSPAGTQTAAFSPDGSRVLTTLLFPRRVAQLWRTDTGALERELAGHTDYLNAAVFSSNGQQVVTAAWDGTVRLWDANTGGQIRAFTGHAGGVFAAAISPDGSRIAGGGSSFDPTVRLWNAQTGQPGLSFWEDAGTVRALAFSPSGTTLLVGWESGLIRLFDVTSGAMTLEILVPSAFLNAAVFSPNGEFILTADNFPIYAARLWDARTGELLRTFAGHTWQVGAVAFNRAGTEILTGGDNVRLWSIAGLAARLRTASVPGGLELRWSLGTLQQADAVDGTWRSLGNATSPWTISTATANGFFRVLAPAED